MGLQQRQMLSNACKISETLKLPDSAQEQGREEFHNPQAARQRVEEAEAQTMVQAKRSPSKYS